MSAQYGEPWRLDDDIDDNLVKAGDIVDSRDRLICATTDADLGVGAETVAGRIVRCVNFLAGIPDAAFVSDKPLPVHVELALAVLRGNTAAAYALADAVIEGVVGERPAGHGRGLVPGWSLPHWNKSPGPGDVE